MSTPSLQAIVLAAGQSTGFKTGKTKLIATLCGQEIILYITRLLQTMKISSTVVVGYQKELVTPVIQKEHADLFSFVEQQEHQSIIDILLHIMRDCTQDNILIINADMPLIKQELIDAMCKKHNESNATITLVTSHVLNPQDDRYGRVIKKDQMITIAQPAEIQDEISEHCCIDAGIYIIKKSFLEKHTATIQKIRHNHDFYMNDLIHIANEYRELVTTLAAPFDSIRGINTLQELWAAEQIKRSELIRYWMDRGVRFSAAQNVHIDLNISIGAGSFVGCGAHIIGNSSVGQNSSVMEFSTVENSIVGDNVLIEPYSIVRDSVIKNNAIIGPFAHIRSQSEIQEQARIGNFVEVKNSQLGPCSTAKHLAYIGDTTTEQRVNIGAGTITCNYDGAEKYRTVIKEDAFIGSNSTLIAPVTVEKNAYVAAGSTITETVPADALAIARSRQTNKEGYALKLKRKRDKQEEKSSSNSFVPAKKVHYPPNMHNNSL